MVSSDTKRSYEKELVLNDLLTEDGGMGDGMEVIRCRARDKDRYGYQLALHRSPLRGIASAAIARERRAVQPVSTLRLIWQFEIRLNCGRRGH